MLVSPHTHGESPLTGSTLSAMVARAKELGRTHFAYTDLGHMSSALKAHGLCKPNKKAKEEHLKKELKFIPGIEIYFKDLSCDIISGTPANRCKYFTITLYAEDQESFQELVKIASKNDFNTIELREENKNLWTWKELEELSKFKINAVLGGVHCMVGKLMLAGQAPLGEKVLLKLKSLFKDSLYTCIIAEPWTKKWSKVVEIFYTDGTKDTILAKDLVNTDRARRIKAIDLVDNRRHSVLISKSVNSTHYDVNKTIEKTILHKGFLPLPGGDASLKVNKFLKALSTRHGITTLVSDYAYYSNKEDKIVQTMVLEGEDKLHSNFHMKTEQEIKEYLNKIMLLTELESDSIVANNNKWASRFDNLQLKYDWRLAIPEGDPFKLAMDIVKANGRMRWDDKVWVDRLKEELTVIAKNPKKDLTAYFLPIRDVLNHYKENGLLTGPGRGSAGGSLFCYLLGITQINPFKYDLPFNRFFSMDRIMLGKLPDIDVDLESRELLVGAEGNSGYLYGRWGDKAAQISTRTTVRLKSAIKDTNRYFKGKVDPEIEVFAKGLPAPPQGIKDLDFVFGFEDEEGNHVQGLIEISNDLKKYTEERSREWSIVEKAMGITKAFSKHASAFVLSDIPIKDIVPTKEGYITQYEAKECEAAGLIKYDFLVVKQLKDIRVCIDLINKKNKEKNETGYFSHDGEKMYIWNLPERLDVMQSIWSGSTETLFQINSRSMIPFVKEILPQNMTDLSNILAVVRPGPLDFVDPNTGRTMAAEYVMRHKKESEPDIQVLADLLPETYGIFIFQEQLTKVAKELAGFPGDEAEILRENMAKKKKVELMSMKPKFIEGASKKVDRFTAEEIWNQMETFGRYGFSIIHAVEYAHITYACMFLKYHYSLEWWAAVLSNADEKEITGELWKYVKQLVLPPDINLSKDEMVVDYINGKIRSKLGVIRGIGEKTIEPIVAARPYRDIQDFVDKDVAGQSLSHKLIHVGVLDSLFPPKANLLEKLKAYEDAVEKRKFIIKKESLSIEKQARMRIKEPKEGVIPEEYIRLHPMKDASMKKAVLPSMPIDFYELGKKYSKSLAPFENYPAVISPTNHKTPLVNGEDLKALDEQPGFTVSEDKYVAATCYIIEAKEFSFSGGSKRALKLNVDADGYISEKVLWPDYNTGELIYPIELKKGAIVTIFFRKRTGRDGLAINGITIES